MGKEKSTRGNASQFFVAGELCRRGYSAVVTLGNTPNTDILCSNIEGTKFVHIQRVGTVLTDYVLTRKKRNQSMTDYACKRVNRPSLGITFEQAKLPPNMGFERCWLKKSQIWNVSCGLWMDKVFIAI